MVLTWKTVQTSFSNENIQVSQASLATIKSRGTGGINTFLYSTSLIDIDLQTNFEKYHREAVEKTLTDERPR